MAEASPLTQDTAASTIEAMRAAVLDAPVMPSTITDKKPANEPGRAAAEPDTGGGVAMASPPDDRPKGERIGDTTEPCPVTPLGHCDGIFYYVSPSGQIRDLAAGKHSNNEIKGLFEVQIPWLFKAFPKKKPIRDEESGAIVGWEKISGWKPDDAANMLMIAAGRLPIFHPKTMLRGSGVWRAADGRLIIHAGDKLLLPPDLAAQVPNAEVGDAGGGYAVISSGCRVEGKVYPASVAEVLPSLQNPASPAEAARVLKMLRGWNWLEPSSSPILWLGFCASAMISGALRWRPHIHVSGDMGTGKTHLAELFTELNGGEDSILNTSAPSEAGLRQELNGASRPVMVDEIEASAHNKRSRQVQELARLASSEKQGKVLRGSADGKASSFPIRGSFYMTSILHAEPLPQDRTRITFFDLGELKHYNASLTPEEMGDGMSAMKALGPRLRARMILGFERVQQNFDVFYRVMTQGSYTSRQADQLATLLACAETFLHDEVIHGDNADILVESLRLGDDNEGQADHDECLQHLLTSAIDTWRSGTKATVGSLIAEVLDGQSESRDYLRSIGIALEPNNAAFTALHVANNHQALQSIYRDTRWAEGVWKQSLRRLPGAAPSTKAVSFAGVKAKATTLSRELVARSVLEDAE